MLKKKIFFGMQVENKNHKKIVINEVEIVLEGLEIHSKSIILINKSLLNAKLFQKLIISISICLI